MTGRCLLISAAIVLFTTSCGGETAPTQAVSARATWLTVTLTLIANSLATVNKIGGVTVGGVGTVSIIANY